MIKYVLIFILMYERQYVGGYSILLYVMIILNRYYE